MLDIKLKNSNKFKLFILIMAIVLSCAGYMALYPTFESKADKYYKDSLSEDVFLESLQRGNYVLYKEISEKVDGINYSYVDLYLDTEEEWVMDINMDAFYESGNLYEDIDGLSEEMRNQMTSTLNTWENGFRNDIAQNVDYCVIDEESGQFIKNTGRKIEALWKKGMEGEKEELPYVYYVMVTYNGIGNSDRVAVKGKNSDDLLKNVQAVMRNGQLEPVLGYGNEVNPYAREKEYYGVSNLNGKTVKVSCSIKAPKNTTFIYALTQEQKSVLAGGENPFYSSWDEWYSYFRAGAGDFYWMMLGILTVVSVLLMLDKRHTIHYGKIVRIPLEATIFLAVIIGGAFEQTVIELVLRTNKGYFDAVWNNYLFFLSVESFPFLTGAVNFICLFLLFGGWVYAVNTLGEIPSMGIKGYLKERSLCVRIGDRFCRKARKLWRGFKDELLHVDLGEDIKYTLHKTVLINFIILGIICSAWFFGWFILVIYSVALYVLLKKYIRKLQEQYKKLLNATGAIAEGNLNTTFDEDFGVFESYKEALYKIQEGFRKAVDEEVKSQRMKAELITNVSHDLKTPLTAITTYIDLLKEDGITEEQRKEYIGVLEKKSLRLKRLIEDLFEVSKANSRNVTVNLVDVDIVNLIRQVYLEYEEKVEEANLIVRFRMPEGKVILKLDSEKTYRIFENLYSNIIKYAMIGTRVYVDVEKRDGMVIISLRNMSAVELQVIPEELTERFVRGDSSRNTEGSGLGLAIAKSFTEIQGGKMEVVVDGDLFKIVLSWKCE